MKNLLKNSLLLLTGLLVVTSCNEEANQAQLELESEEYENLSKTLENDFNQAVGGALSGGLGGAAIGTAVPVIGTITGGVVGAIGGGLTGAAVC